MYTDTYLSPTALPHIVPGEPPRPFLPAPPAPGPTRPSLKPASGTNNPSAAPPALLLSSA